MGIKKVLVGTALHSGEMKSSISYTMVMNMFNKNTIIIVLAIICLAVIIGGTILVFGNAHEAYNGEQLIILTILQYL